MHGFFSSVQDLRKGTKILAADGATVEVTKVEKQKTNKLLELESLGRFREAGWWQISLWIIGVGQLNKGWTFSTRSKFGKGLCQTVGWFWREVSAAKSI